MSVFFPEVNKKSIRFSFTLNKFGLLSQFNKMMVLRLTEGQSGFLCFFLVLVVISLTFISVTYSRKRDNGDEHY